MRRIRSDSTKTEVEMAATPEPVPPPHCVLIPIAVPLWSVLMRTREYSAWTEVDLEHAVNLATTLADLERLRRELLDQPDITVNPRNGLERISPLHQLVDMLTKRAISLSRLLHVHPEATVGNAMHQVPRNRKHRQILKDLETDENSLLASRTIN